MKTIKRLELSGYKSIRNCPGLSLGKLNVLIGANGSGKSCLVSFFRFLTAIARGELTLFVARTGAAHSLLHFGPKQTVEIAGKVQFVKDSEDNSYQFRLVYAAPDNLVFASETFKVIPSAPGTGGELVTRGSSESIMTQDGFRNLERVQFFARVLSEVSVYHFHDTSMVAGIRGRWRVVDHRRLYPNGENLPAFLSFLREVHPSEYARILETVRLVASSFGEFVLDPPPASPDLVMLNWRGRGSDYEFGPHQLSDGTLRFIALATLLLQPRELLPAMIIIDEPELGLHPFAIKILASLLQDTANFAQILVATQSAALVDQVEPEDVIVVNIEDGASHFERLNKEKLSDWLGEYTLSQIWEMNLVGGRP